VPSYGLVRRLRLAPVAVAVAAAIGGGPGVRAQGQPAPLTLDAAIALALEANKTIQAARLLRPVDLAVVEVAKERPNPEFSFEDTKETPKQFLGLSQTLELGGKRSARIGVANAALATGEAELDRVIAEVRNAVRRNYMALVAAERRVAIDLEVVDLVTRARDAARLRVAAGDAPRRDEITAQTDLLDAQNEVVASRGQAAAERATLNVLLGRAPDAPLAVADTLDLMALPTLQAAIERAQAVNGDLRVLDRQMAEQAARTTLAQAMRKPDASVGGGVTFNGEPEFDTGWRLSAGVTLPIFTTHKAGVTFEQAELARLRAERDARLAEITGDVAAALLQAEAAAARLTTYERDILPLAQQDEAMAQQAYQAGQSGVDALVIALAQSRARRLRGLDAALDFQNALADLERAIGGPIR